MAVGMLNNGRLASIRLALVDIAPCTVSSKTELLGSRDTMESPSVGVMDLDLPRAAAVMPETVSSSVRGVFAQLTLRQRNVLNHPLVSELPYFTISVASYLPQNLHGMLTLFGSLSTGICRSLTEVHGIARNQAPPK